MMHMWDLLSIFFLFLFLYHEKLEFD